MRLLHKCEYHVAWQWANIRSCYPYINGCNTLFFHAFMRMRVYRPCPFGCGVVVWLCQCIDGCTVTPQQPIGEAIDLGSSGRAVRTPFTSLALS